MKAQNKLLLIGASLLALPVTIFAQAGGDPTTPPAGVPGPVMKTLDQVEARIPLVDGAPGVTEESNGGFTISQSGSYYMVGDLSVASGNGIDITASHVTLDMNGFTLSRISGSASGSGINIDTDVSGARTDSVHIENGHIFSKYTLSGATLIGEGFAKGITFQGDGLSISRVSVTGCSQIGIELGVFGFTGSTGNLITDCKLNANQVGIFATNANARSIVQNCTVINSIGTAIGVDHVKNSVGVSINSIGIFALTVTDSEGASEGDGKGIDATRLVVNSSGSSSGTGTGIESRMVVGSYGFSVDGKGIEADMVVNSYGRTTNGSDGVDAPASATFQTVSEEP
ncbi:MAG: hypothetical protein AAF065_00475 [Verrucomicrobiota bacterium]